ncbi:hypothetical protein [Aporhodopirellula aestuarii]|uniref:Uncharacterized protein n=1 Tax=Aporhodopirellula aestuarii TaxID=2950107 RepID=A0ABT0U676_9BACT|nr:hypothetical protein [Aporhodopirellula aestuarii]MCM2372442.1 hypothetical protein [Aporhodopirellula aestuarii]
MIALASKDCCSALRLTSSRTESAVDSRKSLWVLAIAFASMSISGCGGFDTKYGASVGASGQRSVNGFGAFRTALQQGQDASRPDDASQETVREIRTRDLTRLSTREQQNDAIVWIPSDWPPLNLTAVEDWMKEWLKQGNRTLVYIVPDDGSTEAYFREAAEIAPPEQRLVYRRKLAKQINERLLTEVDRDDIKVADWFVADALPYRTHLPHRRGCDFTLKPSAKSVTKAGSASGAGASDQFSEEDWEEDDDVLHQSMSPVHQYLKKPTFQPLVQESVSQATGETKLTTLGRITDKRWGNSEILVVASGGLVTNFAMTAEPAQEMTKTIQLEIRSTSASVDDEPILIAFLATDKFPVTISTVKPGIPQSKGWELMTEMPLSLINMHVAFLGVVLCLMLLPVFGRPRSVRYNRVTHFGNHLSAMATLMRRGGGVDYAHQRISQYLKHVRGETAGPWVLPDPPPPVDPAPLPKNTATKDQPEQVPAVQTSVTSSAESIHSESKHSELKPTESKPSDPEKVE